MNLRIVLYLCLTLNIARIGVNGKRRRIIGGESAEIEEFPYMVSLRLISNNRLICGGTIISQRHILTAAHCITDVPNIHNKIKVQAGSTYLSANNASIFNVLRAYLHPRFTGKITISSCLQHDIGILLLLDTIVFGDSIKKAFLPTRDIIQGEKGIIIGWGAFFYPAKSISDQLQKTQMMIMTSNECSMHLNQYIHKEQFCALESVGIGGCAGDSGGPLIIEDTIIGINSLVIPCALGLPDIYTKVYSYIDFIQSIMACT